MKSEYQKQETTNYQWDGSYSQQNYSTGYPQSTAAGADQSGNGYSLKRSYEQSYDQSSYAYQ